MDREQLHTDFQRLDQANDVEGLKALVPRIEDADPMAAHMLNCIGAGTGLNASTYAELHLATALLRRAEPLAADSLLRAKILGNLVGFYVWGNASMQALALTAEVLQMELPPECLWIHVLMHYSAGLAYAKLFNHGQAERSMIAVLHAGHAPNSLVQRARVALATFAARRADASLVAHYVEQVDEPALIPYVTAVRARLALALGFNHTALDLSRKAASALSAGKPRVYLWNDRLETWALYHAASLAVGDVEKAGSIHRVLVELNGGMTYRSTWR